MAAAVASFVHVCLCVARQSRQSYMHVAKKSIQRQATSCQETYLSWSSPLNGASRHVPDGWTADAKFGRRREGKPAHTWWWDRHMTPSQSFTCSSSFTDEAVRHHVWPRAYKPGRVTVGQWRTVQPKSHLHAPEHSDCSTTSALGETAVYIHTWTRSSSRMKPLSNCRLGLATRRPTYKCRNIYTLPVDLSAHREGA